MASSNNTQPITSITNVNPNWGDISQYIQLSPTFIGGVIVGFITGIASGVTANIITKILQERKFRKTGYLNAEFSGGFIKINGMVKSTTTSQRIVSKLSENVE
ncbi:MAG: hypothetical protein CVV44_19050 [Spirochaetae bacterium HGW-Spirochaetae-1]|jgi:hypothetical protein|nr:MAG: hypothetical protein CVV44_19050 [Spirochaetae bacterium HGW-Spirochaetae-1]